MPVEIQPPELARVVDFSERSRTGDWSLRSALVRYAEGQPVRVSQLLEQVRRTETALHALGKVLDKRGPELWAAVEGGDVDPDDAKVVQLLRATIELDRLGDALASWADDRTGSRPDDAVDAVTAEVAAKLDDLGVPREEAPPRRSGRDRGV
ncbi:MAG: hypothetical protein ACJ739_03135 [Acidimicrobiales bacterium]